MKQIILIALIIMCGMLLTISVQAQRTIEFKYDESGNMTIRRVIDFTSQQTAAVPEDILNNYSDSNTDKEEEKEKVFEDIIGNQDIKIYPNPTSGKLVVDIPNYSHNTNDRIDIYDLQGTLKQRISPLSSSNTIYITSYPPATYIMVIYVNGDAVQWKIIKQ